MASLRALHETMQNMHEHVQLLEKQRLELEHVDESLVQLRSVSKGDEILVQMASGIFVPARIGEVDRLHVNVGADVLVEKSIEQTRVIVQEQVRELSAVHAQLQEKLSLLVAQFEELHEGLKDV